MSQTLSTPASFELTYEGPHPAWCDHSRCDGERHQDDMNHHVALDEIPLTLMPHYTGGGKVYPTTATVFGEQNIPGAAHVGLYVYGDGMEARALAGKLVAMANVITADDSWR